MMYSPKFAHSLLILCGLLTASTSQAAIQFYDYRSTFIGDVNVTTNIDFEGIAGSGQKVPYSNPSGLTISGVNFVGRANLSQQSAPPTFVPGFNLFVAAANAAGVNSQGTPNPDYQFDSGASLEWHYGDSFSDYKDTTVTINLPAHTKVFGTDLMMKRNWSARNPDNIGTHMTVVLSDGTLHTVNMEPSDNNPFGVGIPTRSFFGFVSDQAITSLTIHAGTIPSNQINGGYSLYRFDEGLFNIDGGHPLLDNVILGSPQAAIPEPTSMLIFGMCMAGLGCYARRRRDV